MQNDIEKDIKYLKNEFFKGKTMFNLWGIPPEFPTN